MWTWLSIANIQEYIVEGRAEDDDYLLPTCYTNSTEGSIHESIWKTQQSPTVFLYDSKKHKYWIVVRHYARYRSTTNKKLTFQKVLIVSNLSSQVQLFCSAFFSSALVQTVLMQTVSITEYKGHLKLKRSTAEWHIKTMLLCLMYSMQATEFKNRDMTTI